MQFIEYNLSLARYNDLSFDQYIPSVPYSEPLSTKLRKTYPYIRNPIGLLPKMD